MRHCAWTGSRHATAITSHIAIRRATTSTHASRQRAPGYAYQPSATWTAIQCASATPLPLLRLCQTQAATRTAPVQMKVQMKIQMKASASLQRPRTAPSFTQTFTCSGNTETSCFRGHSYFGTTVSLLPWPNGSLRVLRLAWQFALHLRRLSLFYGWRDRSIRLTRLRNGSRSW